MTGVRTNTGNALNDEWKVGARHALYHKEGKFYMPLEQFPGAYFDAYGYVLFRSEDEFVNSRDLHIGKRVNVPGGIASLSKYKKMR